MAMITCPNCGEQISDKAKSCVHCGESLHSQEKMVCGECGTELKEGMDICPTCGCPITLNQDSGRDGLQQVEVAGVRITNLTKKKAAIAVGGILLLIVVILGVSLIREKITADMAQKAEKEYPSLKEKALEQFEMIKKEYSFERRAEELIEIAEKYGKKTEVL